MSVEKILKDEKERIFSEDEIRDINSFARYHSKMYIRPELRDFLEKKADNMSEFNPKNMLFKYYKETRKQSILFRKCIKKYKENMALSKKELDLFKSTDYFKVLEQLGKSNNDFGVLGRYLKNSLQNFFRATSIVRYLKEEKMLKVTCKSKRNKFYTLTHRGYDFIEWIKKQSNFLNSV
jgi:predicted transcriptional regulator